MMKFRNLMPVLSAVTILAAGTTAFAEEKTTDAQTATGVYSLYNTTGEEVKEIYLYEAGGEKGENQCPDGLAENKKLVLTYNAPEDATLVLEFVTESGVDSKFETLHIEDVPIALKAADTVSGATPISFEVPEATGKYTFINTTGEDVTELYVYPAPAEENAAEAATESAAEENSEAATESAAEENAAEAATESAAGSVAEAGTEAVTEDAAGTSGKGKNLAKDGLADGESVDFEYTGPVDTTLIVEFTTATDGTKFFKTLHIEEAKINLLAADSMTGATPIEFTF